MTLLRPTDETRAFVQFGELSHWIAFSHAIDLNKVHLEKHGPGWRARLKGTRKGKPMITFLGAPTYTRLLILIGDLADKDGLNWYEDKYP